VFLLSLKSCTNPWSDSGDRKLDMGDVTPGFKGKFECIEYMWARIKLHTCTTQCIPKHNVKA
jgi:hypothetical protein